jgi:hypothetical protein
MLHKDLLELAVRALISVNRSEKDEGKFDGCTPI